MQINALSHSTAEPDNNYLYNGKELQDNFGLDWYEYGFRMYDAQTGRFPSLDPKADEFAFVSPYNYAENRPINGIDLYGLQYLQMLGQQQNQNIKRNITYNNNSIQRAILANQQQATISQGATNYVRYFNSTVSPDMQTQIATSPVYKSVGAGVVAAPFVEVGTAVAKYAVKNAIKSFMIDLSINLLNEGINQNGQNVKDIISSTAEQVDLFDAIVPSDINDNVADAVTTAIDISIDGGVQVAGIDKEIKAVIIDFGINTINNVPQIKKWVPNSNYSRPLMDATNSALKNLKIRKDD